MPIRSEALEKVSDALLALLVIVGYASPVLAAGCAIVSGTLTHVAGPAPGVVMALAALAVAVTLVVFSYRRIRRGARARFRLAAEILVLGLLIAWGLFYNALLGDKCVTSTPNDAWEPFRPLAVPEVAGLVVLHACTVLAYAVSRRRPAALHPAAEIVVHAGLMIGIGLHALVTLQFGKWVLPGLAFPPVFLPCVATVLTVVLYTVELRARLRMRGAEAATLRRPPPADSAYRLGPDQPVLPGEPTIHVPTLLRALALSPALLGLYSVTQLAWLHGPWGPLQVFTRTCGHTLSTLPIEVIAPNGHYLCTVAARGHTWLVRPLRLGRRHGTPILVNRQLAIANAFEDLLHERWPRLGAAARSLYDRLGLPVSRLLRARWMADLVYVTMKPFEWLFYLALVLFDPRTPEERVERMYR